MLNKIQISEIKEHLEKAQNPVFFFDNDCDGLCSFLLLQRFIGRGKGVAIKSFPALDETYFRKVEELNADYVFILDKPHVSEEFFKRVQQINLPVVWIDHHDVELKVPDFVDYYNVVLNFPSTNEPVTAICYEIVKQKKDLWLAVIGCITDSFLPSFYDEFAKDFPDLAIKATTPFDVLYKSKIGEISKLLNNGLKDKTTNVVNMLRLLMGANSPYELLEENNKTYTLHKRAKELDEKYKILLEKGKKIGKKSDKILFFQYAGNLSISAELSNELSYIFPEKIVVVVYVRGTKVNLSLRGKNIRERFLKVIETIEGAVGGGHRNAVGGVISPDHLEEFRKKLEKNI